MSNGADVLPGAVRPGTAMPARRRLSWRQGLALSARLLLRDWRAGELRVLVIALIVAVASLTTVAFFADRVRQALNVEANHLLGADLMVLSDRPIDAALVELADRLELQTVDLVRFPSMVGNGDESVLTQIKAVGSGYPLKGHLTVRTATDGAVVRPDGIPAAGTAWADDRLMARLDVSIGDSLQVGTRSLRIAAQVMEDPETSVGFLSLGPRLTMNRADLDSTGLIAPGSRVGYRLGVAGPPQAVAQFRTQAQALSGPGQRVEDVRDARPEIKSALERAEKFLGLSALLSVVLAAVAVALAARRYLRRHLDGVAVMRCLGATQPLILRLHVQQFVVLGVIASAIGCALGLAGQAVLAALLAPLVGVSLPVPGVQPLLQGFVAGFVLLLGFALPPIFALRRVPTLRVLRRDLGLPDTAGWLGYIAGVAALGGLILWDAQDPRTGWYVLAGALATMLALGLATLALLGLFARIGRRAP
ncbi:MAG: ABC transporter permease, partial [Burkholderiales bacterium]|nr:ABC transporter permease [Burkholderiales bacterium]